MKILLVHGPNLNLLGERESKHYGTATLEQINQDLSEIATGRGHTLESYQSNIEGELVNKIQEARKQSVDGILINPAAYGHTSVAIRDALIAVKIPFVEVHLSNIAAREEFRHKSLISDIAQGGIFGFGPDSYKLGLSGLMSVLQGIHKN
ncbi:MAG: type II 3-dehydroquinate dehydratase [Candidatus Melainabacteria bacterium]|nr:MAG: type II 3-dehydroquinate dehydratase [Candidatus Melainabacteria bacterium]